MKIINLKKILAKSMHSTAVPDVELEILIQQTAVSTNQ